MFFNAIGAIQKQVKKYQNLVTGGNFAIDTDHDGIANGWYTGTSTSGKSIQNNTQYWTPSTAGVWSGCLQSAANIPNIKGHKYYFSGNLTNITYVLTDQIFMEGAAIVDGFNSKIFASSVDAALTRINFYARTANIQCSVSKPVLYDLTAEFGAGNEPDLAWCNANIAPNIMW